MRAAEVTGEVVNMVTVSVRVCVCFGNCSTGFVGCSVFWEVVFSVVIGDALTLLFKQIYTLRYVHSSAFLNFLLKLVLNN